MRLLEQANRKTVINRMEKKAKVVFTGIDLPLAAAVTGYRLQGLSPTILKLLIGSPLQRQQSCHVWEMI